MTQSAAAPVSVLSPKGLTQAEAQARLAAEGFNELPRASRRSPLRIVRDVLREPMLALLLAGGVVYLLLGSRQEALILLAFACLSVGITVVQEARTERVLEALRDLTSPRALVIRNGVRLRIAGREVARGDVIVLSEGDRVSADARLLEAQGLSADESLLTGEAVPVRKAAGAVTGARPGGEDQPMVYSGSLIVRGAALAEVTATGPASEIGRIGTSLDKLDIETPHLQRQMRKLVMVFAALGASVSIAVVALYGMLRGGWPRIQAAMMDEDTITVAYRDWRGEPRGKATVEGSGDCIDCMACVNVCPTGIDIRDGQQLACITCALCIDACDDTMAKIGKPRGLIDYLALTDEVAERAGTPPKSVWKHILRPRTALYTVLWAGVGAGLVAALFLRSDIGLHVTPVRNPTFVTLSDGSIRNTYDLRLLNEQGDARDFRISMTSDQTLVLSLEGQPAQTVTVPGNATTTQRIYIVALAGSYAASEDHTDLRLWVEDLGNTDRIHSDTIFNGKDD